MKNLIIVLIAFLPLIAIAQHEHHSTADSIKTKSPRKTAMEMVGDNHVHIDYGSPSVRGRMIWNGLVAFGQVWATGAHKSTWIEFSQDVKINSQVVPKGKYGLFTIPDKKEWTIILSKDWDMHLADDYKSENDLLRFKVKPNKSKRLTEAMTYQVKALGKEIGQVNMAWEYLTVAFDFENQ
ncbi:MAG: DUF2911 domain-containing protein [Cyclobacteriaceae bacterium]|nr:DUF2911 domain-containing protein [Cyclobacteriaceae bacterium]